MSEQKDQKSKDKIQVNDLPLKEKELTEDEARKVRGGGGPSTGSGQGRATVILSVVQRHSRRNQR